MDVVFHFFCCSVLGFISAKNFRISSGVTGGSWGEGMAGLRCGGGELAGVIFGFQRLSFAQSSAFVITSIMFS